MCFVKLKTMLQPLLENVCRGCEIRHVVVIGNENEDEDINKTKVYIKYNQFSLVRIMLIYYYKYLQLN